MNGHEILARDKHALEGMEWKYTPEGRQGSAKMPPVAWLARNNKCFEDWKEDARKKLDERYTKTQVEIQRREALLIREWGPEEHRKKIELANLTLPSKKLIEICALLKTAHKDCAMISRMFIKCERGPQFVCH